MPSGLIFQWAARGGVLKRRGHLDQGGSTGGPVIIPAQLAGSAPVGSANYPIPTSNVIFVDPANGNNAGSGSIISPYKTVEFAASKLVSGGTIVCRGGIYHEGKVGTGSIYAGIAVGNQTTVQNVTVQNYPGEAVWFDGSSIVTGWAQDGALYRHDGWTLKLDRSPTFSFGVPDDPTPGWSFVNPAYPTAAWPEQLFIDGAPQTQVASKAAVTAGTFFIDQTNQQVFIGTNPIGKEVRISDLQTTISGLGVNTKFRGLGFRRFAPSQPHLGAVKMVRAGCYMENCWFEDISGTALSFQSGSNMKLANVTIYRGGCINLHASNADGLEVYRIRTEQSNARHFNYAPASGGIKITRQRGFILHESVLSNNYAKGLWTDESVSNVKVYNNDFINNEQRACSFELTGDTIFANNLIVGAGYNGLDFLTSDRLRSWNNTIVSSGRISPDRYGVSRGDAREFNVQQDKRGPMTSSSVGVDTRYPVPHPDGMTWIVKQVEAKNNIYSKMGVVGQLLTIIEDLNKGLGTARDKSTYGIDWDGNFYNRIDSSHPTWLSQLPNAGSANGTTYFDLNALKGAGFEPHSMEVTGLDALNGDYTIKAPYKAQADANARPLPSDIAALVGQPVGTLHVGCWR